MLTRAHYPTGSFQSREKIPTACPCIIIYSGVILANCRQIDLPGFVKDYGDGGHDERRS